MSQFKPIRYQGTNQAFVAELKKRVEAYFIENDLKPQADSQMVLKTVAMFLIFFAPYFLMLIFQPGFWGVLLAYSIIGFGSIGIGFCVMHDAIHGAYSSSPLINRLLGYSLDLVGASSFNWRLKHNMLHHTYTNILGLDEDIEAGELLRFSYNIPLQRHHRFQHIYGPILYSFLTISWLFWEDLQKIKRYFNMGIVSPQMGGYTERISKAIVLKVGYVFLLLVLPILILPTAWWQTLICFVIMHLIIGFTISMIFQLAHVMGDTEQPVPNEDGVIEQDWLVHQLETTTNFAPKNKFISWCFGGLNFQVEHHLFPNICHIHYSKIAPIVEKTAREYGIPYNCYKTFRGAIWAHLKYLKTLGKQESMPA